ncbi:MAG: hypothetical protein OXI20_14505 [Rhodospirillales bacterium]|nr:hypothetical protein [Rhodospirillales bacterium]
MAAFLIHDLAVDAFVEGEVATTHFVLESIVFAAVLAILGLDLRDLADLRARLRREKSRNRALSGEISAGIEAQMARWNFTPSEKDVAWMIVKGYRFAEIADMRGVREGTARLQATSVYGKAGVHGRAEFVAEIVQELLTPIWEDPEVDEAPSGRESAGSTRAA